MATDIATLGLRIDNGQVTAATTSLDQLGARGDAVAGRLQRNFQGATQAAGGLSRAAENATPGMGRFNNAIANLGLSAVGVQGPMQKVVETIAILGVGGGVVTAALAGLAALAYAHDRATRAAREHRKAVEELLASTLEAARQASGGDLAEQRAILQKEVADMERRVAQGQHAVLGVSDAAWGRYLVRLEDARAALAEMDRQIAAFNESRLGEHRRNVDAATQATEDWRTATLSVASAFAALTKSYDTWQRQQGRAGGLFTMSSVLGRTNAAPTLPSVDLAEMDRVARDLTEQTLRLLPPTQAVATAWADSARRVAEMVQVMGLANDSVVLLGQNLISAADQVDSIVKTLGAGGKVATGDLLGALSSVGAVLSSVVGLFGGGNAARDAADRRALDSNTEAIRRLTDRIGDFGLAISGNQFTEFQRVLGDILALPEAQRSQSAIDARFSGTWQQFRDIARDIFGIDLNVAGWQAWLKALDQLNEAVKQSELTQFAETFSGQLQAMEASFRVFNITDPAAQLKELAKVLGDVAYGIHGGMFGVGAPAFEAALQRNGLAGSRNPLDLGSAGDRAILLLRLQDLFRSLQAGTLAPSQLGGLTAQEFLDNLTRMIDLIRQTEEAAQQNADSLRATAQVLRDFSDSLKLGSLTVLSPVQQLVEARRQYDLVREQALAGDAAAANRVPGLAQAFLEASRAVNASGPAYAADFARVLSDTNILAAKFEDMGDIAAQTLDANQQIVTNTGTLVTQQAAAIAVLQDGFSQSNAKIAALTAEVAENTRVTKQVAEAGLL